MITENQNSNSIDPTISANATGDIKKKKKKKAPYRKEPVSLRQKVLKNGNVSLYLDIYWEGDREYDFLKIYLVKPNSDADREQNNKLYTLAETIRAQRILDLQTGKYKLKFAVKKASFIQFFKEMAKKKKSNSSEGNSGNWSSALKHLLAFTKEKDITFEQADTEWLSNFKEYLSTIKSLKEETKTLSQNSQLSYFNKVKAALEVAFEKGIINEQTGKRVKSPKAGEEKIVFLEWREIQALAKTQCESPLLKRAFLFSVLSGLRWSDIVELKWSEIRGNAQDGYFIDFTQKKTEGFNILPIANQALTLLGKRGHEEAKIFKGLKYSSWLNMILLKWMVKAGIYRHITFHVARHTYATQLLAHGVDIYVVSKMLGHKHLKTTERYAKVVIQLKVKAANSLPLINFNTSVDDTLKDSRFINSPTDLKMLGDWLNDNRITVSSLMTLLSNTKQMMGAHTQNLMLQGQEDYTLALKQGQVLTAVNFVSSLSI